MSVGVAVREAPQTGEGQPRQSEFGNASYLEIEVSCGQVNLFERQGDGKTAEVVRALARYGLHLAERVSSPCG